MPLPDADPKPNKANIYEQFSHITAQEFTRDNLDVVLNPLFLNNLSEDVLRRIKLIGETTGSLSSSGVLADAGGAHVVTTAFDETGPLILPPVGQVWRIQLLLFSNATDVTVGSIPQMVSFSTAGDVTTEDNAQFLFDSAFNISAGGSSRLTDNMLGLSQDLTLTSKVGLRYVRVAGSPTSGTLGVTVFYVQER